MSGVNTSVTITRGNLFGGLYSEDTQGTKLRITDHATVSLAGTNDRNAGVLFAAKGVQLLVEDGAKVEVPESAADNGSYGVINSRDTVFDGATLEVANRGTLGIVPGMDKKQNTASVFGGSSNATASQSTGQDAPGLLTLRNSTFNVAETGRVLAKNISIRQTGDKAVSTIAGNAQAKDYAVEGGKLSIGSKGSLTVEDFTQTAGEVIAEGRLAVKDNLKVSGGRLTFAYQHEPNQTDAKTLAITGGEVVNNGVFVIENVSISNAAFNNKSQLCTSNINLEAGGTLNSGIEDKNLQFNELNLKQGAVLNLPNANSKVGFQDAIELKHGKLNLLGGDLRVAGNRHYDPVIINGPSQLDSGSWAASLLVAGNYAFTDIDIRKGDAFVGLQNPATDMLEALTHPGRLTVSNLTVAQGSTLAVNENSALTVTASAKNAGTISVNKGSLYLTAWSIGLIDENDQLVNKLTDFNQVKNTGIVSVSGLDNITVDMDKLNGLARLVADGGTVNFGKIGITIPESGKDEYGYLTVKTANSLSGVHVEALEHTVVSTSNTPLKGGSYGSVVVTSKNTPAIVDDGAVLQLNGSSVSDKLISDLYDCVVPIQLNPRAHLRLNADHGKLGAINSREHIDPSTRITIERGEFKFRGDVTAGVLDIYGSMTLDRDEKSGLPYKLEAGELFVPGHLTTPGIVSINKALILGEANIGTLDAVGSVSVGNDSVSAALVLEILKNGYVYADPDWDTGTGYSTFTIGEIMSGRAEAGRNSLGLVGSTDINDAKAALARSGHVIAKPGTSPNAVNSAVLVRGQKNAAGAAVPIAAKVSATNTTAPDTTTSGFTGTAAGSLMIIDVGSLGTGKEATGVFSEAVTNDGIIYLADAKAGDKIRISNDSLGTTSDPTSTGIIELEGDRILSAAPASAGGATLSVSIDDAKTPRFSELKTINTVIDLMKTGAYDSRSGRFNQWLMNSANGLTDAEVVAVGNDAAMLGATSAAGAVAMDALASFNDSVASRTSVLANRGEGTSFWADVLAGRHEAKKLMDGRGYKSDFYGGVLGADTMVNGFTLGAAVTIATADSDSTNTLVASSTDSDFVGISFYGAKAFGQFNAAADLGYMKGSNDVSVKAFDLGSFSADTDAFTIGLRGEFLVEAGSFRIVPHAGLRYSYLKTDGFEAAYTTSFEDMNIFQMPVGVTLTGTLAASGWNVAPMIDLSVVPAFGAKDADMNLGISGMAEKTSVSTQIIDSNLFRLKLGVAAQKDNLTFALNYRLGAGSDKRMNNSFNATVSYAF